VGDKMKLSRKGGTKLRLQDFTYDEQTGVFISTKQQNFCYNDGDKTENYILNQIKKARDLSDGSDELSSVIKGWASHYHLAPERSCIGIRLRMWSNY
jgi:hypothetical protein